MSRRILAIGTFALLVIGGCFEKRMPSVLTCGDTLPACPQDMACSTAGRCVPASTLSCQVAEGTGRIGTLVLFEDFEALGNTGVWSNNEKFGNWQAVYNGSSIVAEDDPRQGKVLSMTSPDNTGFVITNRDFSNLDVSAWVRIRAIRPNYAGYAALAWGVQPDRATYLLTVLENYWAMLGRSPTNMDTPRIEGDYPFGLNRWQHVRVVRQGTEMQFYTCDQNGAWTLTSSSPFSSSIYGNGPFGLVSTHATIDYDDIRIFE